jgi:hypothetical protein
MTPRTHLRRRGTSQPMCNMAFGWHAPLKLSDERAHVTCRRCVQRCDKERAASKVVANGGAGHD